MAKRKISELPVVDGEGRPIGLIDITDVVGLFPASSGDMRTDAPQRFRIASPEC
jgi:arabinose-5-phosphate isomerase